MDKLWYIFKKDHHLGPFSLQNLRELYQRGTLGKNDQIWTEGQESWRPLSAYKNVIVLLEMEDDKHFKESYRIWLKDDLERIQLNQTSPKTELPPHLKSYQVSSRNKKNTEKGNLQIHQADLPNLPELPITQFDQDSMECPSLPSKTKPVVDGGDEWSVVELGDGFKSGSSSSSIFEPFEVKLIDELGPVPNLRSDLKTNHEHSNHSFKEGDIDFKVSGSIGQAIPITPLPDSLEEKITKRRQLSTKVALFFVLFILLVVGSAFYMGKNNRFQWPEGPAQYVKDELQTVVFSKDPQLQMKAMLGMNKTEIWVAMNRHYDAHLQIELNSIPMKILSEKQISVNAVSLLHNRLAIVDKIKFIKGGELVPGYYTMTVKSKRVGIVPDFARKLGQTFDNDILASFIVPELIVEMKQDVLLSIDSKEEFDKRLATFWDKLKEFKLSPFKAVYEHLNTLEALGASLLEIYSTRLRLMRSGKDIRAFNDEFTQKIGLFLQTFITSEFAVAKKYQKEGMPELAKLYFDMIELAKEISLLGSDMSHDTKKYDALSAPLKQKLLNQFTQESEKILEVISSMKSELDNKISTLKL